MKYRVAAVSYINTLPLLKGLRSQTLEDEFDVILAHPARCAQLLEEREVDIALCPVGALASFDDYRIITDYCIGCDGPVRTVSVYADQPISTLDRIVLTLESRTSNLLVEVLNKFHWHYSIEFVHPELQEAMGMMSQGHPKRAGVGKESMHETTMDPVGTGFLHIGDICFAKEKEYAHRLDLGASWKEWTGLPFAFACWVSREPVPADIIDRMNAAFAEGIGSINHLELRQDLDVDLIRSYLSKNISFRFDERKQEAVNRFLEMARML